MAKNSIKFCLALFAIVAWLPMRAQVSLNVLNASYSQDFNTLGISGTPDVSTLPGGWTFLEAGTNGNTTYGVGTGSSNAGNTYSLGTDGDRALGGLRSGSLVPVLGASFTNNTGAVITSLQISYGGEQWRLGATPRTTADRLDFQYSLNASSLSSGGWTDVDALDFTAPVISGTVGALPGNTNRVNLTFPITGLAIAPGATFWIRWNDFDVSAADDALGIDDFTLTPQGVPSDQPNLSFTPSSLNFGTVNTGSSRILTYTLDGSNLDDTHTLVTETNSSFTLSLDGVSFTDVVAVVDSTVIYVRFSPLSDGTVADSILHRNGDFTKSLAIQGIGYDPVSNIIPIVEARAQAVGTRLTVAGRVTAGNQFGSPSYVQDATGGIPVFDFNLSNNVVIGDSIVVTGPIGLFNEQKQISGNGISFFKGDSTSRILAPKNILIEELAVNEGMLVTVQNLELVNKAFVFYPQSTEQMTNGSVQADLRIDGDTNLPGLAKPQGVVNITGIVGRFQANAQLMPRFVEDVPGAILPEAPSDSIPRAQTFDLMNWNIEFFGAEREDYPEEFGPADEPLQLQNVKTVILNQKADVIAVQEVSSEEFFDLLVSQLPGYASICSQRYSHSFDGPDNTFPPQKVCYIYDTATVRIVSYRAMFEQLYDSARNGSPSLLPGIPGGDPESFWSSGRLPFLLTADVTINGATERISFVNLHAKSGGTSMADFDRRAYDGQVLKDSLDAYFSPEKFVILGDLNDDLDQSILPGRPTPYAPIVNDTVSYLPITKALGEAGAKSTVSFNDVIDHQILSNDLGVDYIDGSVRIFAPFQLIPGYATTTSDHLPVLSRYKFTVPVVSFNAASASVTEGDSTEVVLNFSKPFTSDSTITISVIGETSDVTTIPARTDNVIRLDVAKGSTTVSLRVAAIDDAIDESDETMTFALIASSQYETGSPDQFTLTIIDNDMPTISFVAASTSVVEGSGKHKVLLSLSSPTSSTKSVTVSIGHGPDVYYGLILDYIINPAPKINGKFTLTIPAGAREASFEIIPLKDLFREDEETVTFTISSVSNGLNIGAMTSTQVHIVDLPPCLPIFLVYPNPTNGPVNIWTPEYNEDNIVNGVLFDPNGNLIATADGTAEQLSDRFTEAMSGRRRGIYTVRLIQCDQKLFFKIVKW